MSDLQQDVEVRCLTTVLHAPAQSATPIDIEQLQQMPYPPEVNMTSSAVFEYAATLGIERPLRSYEHSLRVKNL